MPSTPREKPSSKATSARATQGAKVSRRVRGPSPLKTALTRNGILTAALAEFTEVGIARTTMDKIAQRAGLAKGTLYLHFGSKEALLQGALEATISESALSAIDTPRKTGESVHDYVLRLVLPSMERWHISGRAELARLMLGEARSFPSLAAFYRQQVFTPWHAHFEALFRQAAEEGELNGIDPATASYLLGAPLWWMLAQQSIEASPPANGASLADLTRAQVDAIFGVRHPAPAKVTRTSR